MKVVVQERLKHTTTETCGYWGRLVSREIAECMIETPASREGP